MILIFDTETTGTGRNGEAYDVIEIASLAITKGKPVTSYRTLMKPHCPVDPGASKVNGYYDADLAHLPPSREVLQNWWGHVLEQAGDEEIILCAHNAAFDIGVVKQHIKQVTREKRLCTLRLARELIKDTPNHKLTTLHNHLCQGSVGRNAHTALDDCKMTYEILLAMLARSSKSLEEIIRDYNTHELLQVVDFGKRYPGKLWSEIKDRGWLDFNTSHVKPAVAYTAQYYLNKLEAGL
jgi:DNA polymerase-3 subunit epsilon